jgi:hypothetical protein
MNSRKVCFSDWKDLHYVLLPLEISFSWWDPYLQSNNTTELSFFLLFCVTKLQQKVTIIRYHASKESK